MKDLTVEQLEQLIVLEENKLGTMRSTDEGYREAETILSQLRDMRQKKIYGESEA